MAWHVVWETLVAVMIPALRDPGFGVEEKADEERTDQERTDEEPLPVISWSSSALGKDQDAASGPGIEHEGKYQDHARNASKGTEGKNDASRDPESEDTDSNAADGSAGGEDERHRVVGHSISPSWTFDLPLFLITPPYIAHCMGACSAKGEWSLASLCLSPLSPASGSIFPPRVCRCLLPSDEGTTINILRTFA